MVEVGLLTAAARGAVGVACLLTVAAMLPGADAGAQTPDAIVSRSLLNAGDVARLQRVFARAQRGDAITVAVIGGSITAGAMASKPELRYGDRMAAWWRKTFPRSKVTYVNAGIGATGSDYGCLRAQRDLLSHKPDFVVVEFAVNDANTQASAETVEGLIRQILKQPNQPAVVMLFMMHEGGGNAQEWLSKVGAHYNLPMVSYRDALWPEIDAKRMAWNAVMADQVHPNDRGHEYAAELVTRVLDTAYAKVQAGGRLPRVAKLKAPLLTDLFEFTKLKEAVDLKPVTNTGWTLDEKAGCWSATQPGSVIELEVPGRLVFTMHFRIRRGMGRARVQVDDRPPVTLEGWFDQTWGGWRSTSIAARDLPLGTHRVRVELLADKAAESDEHLFQLMGIGTAGVHP